MRGVVLPVCVAALAAWPVQAQEAAALTRGASGILTPGKGWELLGEGYQLTADPAVDRQGNVYFTDARKNRILKIDLEGRISTWKEGSNGAHGIACGPDGRLYVGQHDRKRIVAFGGNGSESVIAEGVQTHHLTVTSRNDVYFTEAPTHRVWLVDAAGRQRVVHEGLNWPRGVRASVDQARLVVGDPPANEIWRFQIQKDGSLVDGRAVYRLKTMDGSAEADSGGMAFDAEGFLYVATKLGVQVFDREARLRAMIEAPGNAGVNNVMFAGSGLQWLYVTDGERVYRRPVRRRGAMR
uniref:Gluconolactonase n=1 Tax=Solibacter usitatus (strain Ellin6076) TaxID=234267 RepID=Q01XZ1_SOLUE